MTTTPNAPSPREELARIIDPEAFRKLSNGRWIYPDSVRDGPLAKADEWLSHHPAPAAGEEPCPTHGFSPDACCPTCPAPTEALPPGREYATVLRLLADMDAEAMPNEGRAQVLAGMMIRPTEEDRAWSLSVAKGLPAASTEALGVGELDHVIELLQDAKARCIKIEAARRRIGPIATQANSATHALAKAIAILAASPSPALLAAKTAGAEIEGNQSQTLTAQGFDPGAEGQRKSAASGPEAVIDDAMVERAALALQKVRLGRLQKLWDTKGESLLTDEPNGMRDDARAALTAALTAKTKEATDDR